MTGNNRLRKNLPARMRQKKTSSGKVYYYYDTCLKPRKWIALGCHYIDAIKKYAEYEKEYCVKDIKARIAAEITFEFVVNRYVREVIPTKGVTTQKGNMAEVANLLDFFNHPPAPLNLIEPVHIRQYLDLRGQVAKTRANREVALFSHIFNKAREWGYTSNENPCKGVKKFTEKGRDVYITDELFWMVYENSERHIQFLLIVAYLIGQRVSDCLKIKVTDIIDGEIWIKQNKSAARLRVEVIGVLKEVITCLLEERALQKPMHDYLFCKDSQPITYEQLRYGMDRAREKAGIDKALFQFRDLRAKAGTDKDEQGGLDAARALLGHKNSSMTSKYVRPRKGKLVQPTKMDVDREM